MFHQSNNFIQFKNDRKIDAAEMDEIIVLTLYLFNNLSMVSDFVPVISTYARL